MTRHFAAAMRRATKLMRPARATRTVQKAMTGLVVKAMLSPLSAAKPKQAVRRSASIKTSGSLGSVVAQLGAGKALRAAATRKAVPGKALPAIPSQAQYLLRSHRTAAGSRDYRLYLPASKPKGLVLMLHGCNQNPDDFALGTRMNTHAEKNGLAIIYPAQTTIDNMAACWNWFRPGNQGRGTGEPALLASLTRKLMKEFGLGRGSVFVAGLSAGGAMAAILADVYPDVYSAVGIHSGLARGSARDVLSAMSAMRSGAAAGATAAGATAAGGSTKAPLARRIVFQGDNDSTVHPSNAATIVAGALGDQAQPSRVTQRSVRGRGYTRSDFSGPDGTVQLELWMLKGAGHAWSGGRAAGSYTDVSGPDASAQMIRFFLAPAA
ncbi:MAG: alpha/beta hydrolase family esterase [Paracoccaceae bacterium]